MCEIKGLRKINIGRSDPFAGREERNETIERTINVVIGTLLNRPRQQNQGQRLNQWWNLINAYRG